MENHDVPSGAANAEEDADFRLRADLAAIELFASDDKNHRYDLQTAAIIRKVVRPGDITIDIGAHRGEILSWLVQASPEAGHLAIEPIPELAAGLRQDYPTAEVHEVALVANPAGPISFHHVVSNPGYSGIRQRRFDRPNEEVSIIEVPTATLDDIVGDRTIRLIKLDVEGAELGVLEGGAATLSRDKPVVIFEHGLGAADVYGTEPEMIHEFLTGQGLGVYLLATYLEDGPSMSVHQFADQFRQGRNYYFVAAV